MERDELIEQIRVLGAFIDTAAAERALRGTLEALGERLSPEERLAIAGALPPGLRGIIMVGADLGAGVPLATFHASPPAAAEPTPQLDGLTQWASIASQGSLARRRRSG